jgi:hypothetical protein
MSEFAAVAGIHVLKSMTGRECNIQWKLTKLSFRVSDGTADEKGHALKVKG